MDAYTRECLALEVDTSFASRRVTRVLEAIAAWRTEYNEERPHSSLGYRTPKEFAERSRTASYGKDGDKAALENAGCGG